jgi:hypothetical protein
MTYLQSSMWKKGWERRCRSKGRWPRYAPVRPLTSNCKFRPPEIAVSARSSEENIMSATGQKYATLIWNLFAPGLFFLVKRIWYYGAVEILGRDKKKMAKLDGWNACANLSSVKRTCIGEGTIGFWGLKLKFNGNTIDVSLKISTG